MAHEHGYTRYASGECRCDTCRAAWNEYHRRRRRGLKRRAVRRAVRRAYYVGQTRPVTVALSDLAAQLLAHAAQRTGQSENDVVERLLRAASADLQFGDAA